MGTAHTGMLTDQYELTMLAAALRDGTASRPCVFELFGRRLPVGRRYGVVAGLGRALDAVREFHFDGQAVDFLRARGIVDQRAADYLTGYHFAGDIEGYPEGELYFPGSPLLTVSGTFAECVVLETVLLSIYNHDCAIAGAAARMVSAAQGRPIIEMGSRRTHEHAAIAAARAGYLAGFATTSNLTAAQRYGIPTAGTAAHAFTLLHDDELSAFTAQVAQAGAGTTLLVDTYDITRGIQLAVQAAGPTLGGIRIDSGDLGVLAGQARAQLDSLGATTTRIVVSGDLDEFAIAALAGHPVDAYGAGTAVVTGSGAPTAGLVYKLVEVDGRPVAKRSEHKATRGGRKRAWRTHRATGTAVGEYVLTGDQPPVTELPARALQVPLLRDGAVVADTDLTAARDRCAAGLVSLPWEGLRLSHGEPALTVLTEA